MVISAEQFITHHGLERCEFDDECDRCTSPTGGSWAKLYNEPEGVTETEYYICGGCIGIAATTAQI